VVLGGRYRLMSMLGEGGVAAVWRARDMRTGVLRAVKLLPPSSSGSQLRAQRLLREGRVMMRLRHPHIVRVYDAGDSPFGPWYAMELIPGGTLEDHVRREGRLRPSVAVRWMLETLEGLAAAHAVGVIHRDVKPSNLLIDENDRVVIADFGIALVGDSATRETRTGAMLGSMLFMAPEQRLDARSVGSSADIHAVGATLFYAVTGGTPVDLFLTPHDSPRWDGVPAPLRSVVQRAVDIEPERRYPTAEAMAAALHEAQLFLSHDDLTPERASHVDLATPDRSETITLAAPKAADDARPVLVVAADARVRATLQRWLVEAGHAVVAVPDVASALPGITADPPVVALVDLPPGRADVLAPLLALQRLARPPEMVALTAAGDVGTVVRAIRAGAVDALPHPLEPGPVLACVASAAASAPPPVVAPPAPTVIRFGAMSSVAPQMAGPFRALERLAVGSTPVLVLGAPGTGRSAAARSVHLEGPRRGAPLVVISAARLAARTGDAVAGLEEAWAAASGGSLVIDDLDDLTPAAGRWLGRRLAAAPPPGDDETELDDLVRVLATSSVSPDALWPGPDGEALARRFERGTVTLPRLLDRDGDLGHLTTLLLQSAATRLGRRTPLLQDDALAAWRRHGWPRNVRELEDATARVVAVAGDVVRLDDLPPSVRGVAPPSALARDGRSP
jgi:DNA-binding NtrC family response regulator